MTIINDMKSTINQNKDYVTLAELAMEMKINKSNLSYYRSIGLLRPVMTVGRMGIFSRKEVQKVFEELKRLKKLGKSLREATRSVE